jgi:cytochrome d ubiquinol oxidase subunit II
MCGTAAYRMIPYLAGVLAFLIAVFVYTLAQALPVMGRWLDRPNLFIFPLVGALAAVALAVSVRGTRKKG